MAHNRLAMDARVLLFAGAALAALAVACGAGRGAYVEKNARILDALPVMPGAERLTVESSPYYLGDSGPVDGYTTNVVYRAPRDMTAQDVVDFYVGSLDTEWEHCREEIPTIRLDDAVPGQSDRLDGAEPGPPEENILMAHFFRDVALDSTPTVAFVSVNAAGMVGGSPHAFEVVVDHRATRNYCTGQDIR